MTLKCSTSTVQADGEEWFSPDNLSSNGTLGGDTFAVYASNNWDANLFPAWKMFDGDGSTCWYNSSVPTDLIFYNPEPIRLETMEFTNREDAPNYTFTAGTVYGSNDNVTYTLIGSFVNNTTGAGDSYYVLEEGGLTSPDFYKYYKVSLTGATQNGTGMSRVFMAGYKRGTKTVYNPLRYTATTPTYSSNFQGTGTTNSSTGYVKNNNDTLSAFGDSSTIANKFGLSDSFYIQVRFRASQYPPYYNSDAVQIFNLFNRTNNNYPIQFGSGEGNIFFFTYSRQWADCSVTYQANTWYTIRIWCNDPDVVDFGIYDDNGSQLAHKQIYVEGARGHFLGSEPYFLDIYGWTTGTQTRTYQQYVEYDGYNTFISDNRFNPMPKWRMANKSQAVDIRMSNPDYVAPPTPPTPSEVMVTNLSSYDEFGNCYIHSFGSITDVYTAAFTTDTGITASPTSLMTGGVYYTCYWDFPSAIQLTDFTYDTTGTSGSWAVSKWGKENGVYLIDLSDISTSNPALVEGVQLIFYSSSAAPNMPVACKNMTIKYLTGGN